jgi:hypothetical protein
MAEPPEDRYRLDHSRALLERLRVLTDRVSQLDESRRARFTASFREVIGRLESSPLVWGEPQRNLPALGLTIYHAVHKMISVHYTVLQEERVVVIQKFEVTPSFFPQNRPDENT